MRPFAALRLRNTGLGAHADPYWANVSLLMGFEGFADGSTGFVGADEKNPLRGWTAQNAAQTDTAQSKFGSSSYLGSNTSRVATPPDASLDIATGDFTIEAFVRIATLGNDIVFSHWNGSTSAQKCYAFYAHVGGQIGFSYQTSGGTFRFISGAWTPSTNTWYHVAVTRSGNDFRLFVDGVQKGSTATFADTINTSTVTPFLGGLVDNGVQQGIIGHIDELRFTKGVARYTANFTPPSAAFPR